MEYNDSQVSLQKRDQNSRRRKELDNESVCFHFIIEILVAFIVSLMQEVLNIFKIASTFHTSGKVRMKIKKMFNNNNNKQ